MFSNMRSSSLAPALTHSEILRVHAQNKNKRKSKGMITKPAYLGGLGGAGGGEGSGSASEGGGCGSEDGIVELEKRDEEEEDEEGEADWELTSN